ncbi:uncharacterized protein FOMMEDRAFT_159344 [Fomitiporia mediterranea MF3/22]|uniref:uncharacterized protein n=1 Tax=Fomitiporia mediterranea (strain MF3/22) TaxID=694068 RepID=UPI0004409986|nr:uncharacterized protein FOMMEDRAFT_159344 [Fomitiporia mediterranea MF3/22]EJD00596.1 hypothetical protein FOMMEDRAFT_159344 [Fomitiporia mediterranea MF3/22]
MSVSEPYLSMTSFSMANQTLDFGKAYTFSTRSDDEPVDPSLVQLLLSEIITGKYFGVALLTILVYNALTTMDKEIKHFWSSQVESKHHHSEVHADLEFEYILLAAVRQLHGLATYATFFRSVYWRFSNEALLVIEIGVGFGLLIHDNLFEDRCRSVRDYQGSSAVVVNYLLPSSKQQSTGKYQPDSKACIFSESSLKTRLYITAFQIRIIISSPFVANLLTAAGNPTLLCVLGSHLLINLKEAGEMGVNEGTNYRSRTVSNISFAEGPIANASNDESSSAV